MDNEQIRLLIVEFKERAAAHMEQINHCPQIDYDFFHEHITGFILNKFMLQPDECKTERFDDVVEQSLAKSMMISKELVKEFDLAKSCDGATSAMAKKALLFMALERALSITFSAERAAKAVTLHDVSAMLWDAMCVAPQWQKKLVIS